MDENLNQQNQQNWGSMSGNNGSVPPPPPPPEITLRTMQSDIESIKQSGGENPVPKPFAPPEIKKQNNMELEDMSREEGMIKPNGAEGVVPPSEPPKKKLKIFILIAVLVLVVAGAVFAGYKYIYPMFKPAITVSVPETQSPVTSENVEVVETEVPPATTGLTEPIESESVTIPELGEGTTPVLELATTTPESENPESETIPAPVVLKIHTSLLASQADSLVPLTLTASTSLVSIKELLISEAAKKPEAAVALKEVTLSNQAGQLVFADTLPMFLSAFKSSELAPLFEEDFTSVIFYDSNGVWFGMIAKLKEEVDVAAAKALIAGLEKSTDIANLYIQDPGTPAVAGFKDGKANNLSVRYLNFSKTGASLDYGWTSNNLLVISTSYNGIKSMLTKLGVQ